MNIYNPECVCTKHRASKFMRQNLVYITGQINNYIIRIIEYQTPFSIINLITKLKITKSIE